MTYAELLEHQMKRLQKLKPQTSLTAMKKVRLMAKTIVAMAVEDSSIMGLLRTAETKISIRYDKFKK